MDGSCCSSLPMWITALSSSNILCIKIWLFSLTEINIYIYASSMYFSQKEKRIIYLPTNIQESACCRTCSRELARIQKRLKCFWLARVPRFAPVTLSSTKRTLGGGGGTWVCTGAFWSVLSSCVRQPAMANVRHWALHGARGSNCCAEKHQQKRLMTCRPLPKIIVERRSEFLREEENWK